MILTPRWHDSLRRSIPVLDHFKLPWAQSPRYGLLRSIMRDLRWWWNCFYYGVIYETYGKLTWFTELDHYVWLHLLHENQKSSWKSWLKITLTNSLFLWKNSSLVPCSSPSPPWRNCYSNVVNVFCSFLHALEVSSLFSVGMFFASRSLYQPYLITFVDPKTKIKVSRGWCPIFSWVVLYVIGSDSLCYGGWYLMFRLMIYYVMVCGTVINFASNLFIKQQ